MLKKTHLLLGILGLVVFVLQGQYMDIVHNHLSDMPDAPRMLYRSSHIYFLITSVLNIVLGTYLVTDKPAVRRDVQWLVSGIVILAPIFLLAGFFVEPGLDDLSRPFSRPPLYGLFGVGVVLSISGLYKWYRL